MPSWLGSLLTNLTTCGFGIYLVHYLYVRLANYIVTACDVPMQLIIPASAPIVFAFTWATVASLKRLIPGKWLLG